MEKYRPTLILSSKFYNQKTGLLICPPISTSISGAATEVKTNNLDQPSVVAASIAQTLSWRNRKASFTTKAEKGVFDQVILRLIPLMGAYKVIENYLSK